jgi:hypothetical protein
VVFGDPSEVSELNVATVRNDDPCVREDDLEIFFGSSRDGPADLYRAERSSPDQMWGAPQRVTELALPNGVFSAALSTDARTITLTSSALNAGLELYVSSRPDFESEWSMPTLIAELSSPMQDSGGRIVDDGLSIYFCSVRTGSERLHRATRVDEMSAFGQVEVVPTPPFDAGVCNPWVSEDEGLLFFRSPNGSSRDIYFAQGQQGVFESAELVPTVQSDFDESDPWAVLRSDGSGGRLYFSREETPGLPAIWVAEFDFVPI